MQRAGELYATSEVRDAKCSVVDAGGNQLFLVLSGKGPSEKTIVFRMSDEVKGWVEVHSVSGIQDPDRVVAGYLLSTASDFDPIALLNKRLDEANRSRWKYFKLWSRLARAGRQRD